MIRGMYSAASALVVASEQQEVTAHNLAHSSTPGYRERGLVVESFDRVLSRTLEPTGDITGARAVRAFNDFRPGPVQKTEHPFDLALGEPDTFFVLAGPNGPVYTRNGAFNRNAQGQLVSQGGYALQGDGGAITIPPDTTRVTIASDGSITAADGQPLGQVRLVRFSAPQQLTAAGPTLYAAPPAAGLQPAQGRVLQGYREGSNLDPATAMVRLIIGQRYYDAAQRALRSLAETVQLNTRPTG
ncbi:MAG: flagellar hook basal-body protein [Gemmataceae bacterium]|nr:flagellar hook basal-body protein [Gemmataceae bacterium]